jgi:hypothetical protein
MCHGYATGFHLFHKWSSYELPKQINSVTNGCTVAQRRECIRCAAVDYRRVLVHND